MSNSIYNSMRPQNPFQKIINEAKEFRKTFNGNPKDEVQRLLNSGQMSQAQFNQLSQIAQQIVGAMGNN